MKTLVTSLVLLSILAVYGAYFAAADRQRPPKKAECHILENEYTMEGDIEICQAIAIAFAAKSANPGCRRIECWHAGGIAAGCLCLPPRRINLDDPDERLRLARWCRVDGYDNSRLWNFKPPTICVPIVRDAHACYWKQAAVTAARTPSGNAASKGPLQAQSSESDSPSIEVTTE